MTDLRQIYHNLELIHLQLTEANLYILQDHMRSNDEIPECNFDTAFNLMPNFDASCELWGARVGEIYRGFMIIRYGLKPNIRWLPSPDSGPFTGFHVDVPGFDKKHVLDILILCSHGGPPGLGQLLILSALEKAKHGVFLQLSIRIEKQKVAFHELRPTDRKANEPLIPDDSGKYLVDRHVYSPVAKQIYEKFGFKEVNVLDDYGHKVEGIYYYRNKRMSKEELTRHVNHLKHYGEVVNSTVNLSSSGLPNVINPTSPLLLQEEEEGEGQISDFTLPGMPEGDSQYGGLELLRVGEEESEIPVLPSPVVGARNLPAGHGIPKPPSRPVSSSSSSSSSSDDEEYIPRREEKQKPKKKKEPVRKPKQPKLPKPPKEPKLKVAIQCDECGKKFANHQNLERHYIAGHHGQKRREKYVVPSEIKEDKNLGDKYKCLTCGRYFPGRMDNLNRHLREVHTDKKDERRQKKKEALCKEGEPCEFKCQICGSEFHGDQAYSNWIRHQTSVHGNASKQQ